MVSHHRSRSLRRQASLLHPSFRRAPREGTAGLRNPASRDPVRERGDQVFGERTRATAGSDDFANDLGNLILDDMGDNVNAGGAAPAAPYVILSFLFEIVVEFMFLVCALDVICSSDMLVPMISSISATVVMIYLLFIRIKSRSNLLIFSTIFTEPLKPSSTAPRSQKYWSGNERFRTEPYTRESSPFSYPRN